jgi:prepilin-type N-terminal cleavage/methylation domain-containing protein
MINKYNSKNNKGFTLVESMIAISVLALFIGAVSLTISRSINTLSYAKEEVIATYLSQEAVEIIKNQKNTNQLKSLNTPGIDWLEGIAENGSDPCSQNHTCMVDATSPGSPPVFLYRCNGGTCPNLKQDASTFIYNYSGSIDTNFNRSVEIEKESPFSTEVNIVVTVTWMHGATLRTLRTKTLITNWF